jgi:hypothetical protein
MSYFNHISAYNTLQDMPISKEATDSTKMYPPLLTVTATSSDHGEGTQGRIVMSKSKAKTMRPSRTKDGIDLERVIWDPEYRTAIRKRLNRPTAVRQLPRRKLS